MTDDPRRLRRIILLGGAVLVAAALALTWYFTQQSNSDAGTGAPQVVVTTATVTVTAPPSAAISSEAPSATASAAPAGALAVVPPGVVVGYPQTAAGAIAAAGNYEAAILAPGRVTPDALDETLAVIAASPDAALKVRTPLIGEWAQLAGALSVTSLSDPSVIAYGRPLGYRVVESSDTTATVLVYVTGGQGKVTGDSLLNGAFYQVDQLKLVWDGDWKLADLTRAVSSGPKPDSTDAEAYTPFPAAPVPATSS